MNQNQTTIAWRSGLIPLIGLGIICFMIQSVYGMEGKRERGKYFNLAAPGIKPILFSPNLISTRFHEHSYPAFSANGEEVFWNTYFLDNSYRFPAAILFMRRSAKGWSKPAYAPFNVAGSGENPCLSRDGKTIYFAVAEKMKNGRFTRDIWWVKRNGAGWGKPDKVPGMVNSAMSESQPSITENNTLYFLGQLKGVRANIGIFRSEFKEGKFQKPEALPESINSKHIDWTPWIAPDESFILWCSVRPGGFGKGDLYISRNTGNGQWSEAKNLGNRINGPDNERFPAVSPDGKYLFFISDKVDSTLLKKKNLSFREVVEFFDRPGNGQCDVYWVKWNAAGK